ncbi:MAG: FkbM family methyltransferase [Terriglobales bacterium]
MTSTPRKAAFVLGATDQGTFILNRFDYHMLAPDHGIGIGFNLMETSACDPAEVNAEVGLLQMSRQLRGDGVIALDCGANIGVHTVEWARAMTGWGTVVAFEPQERLFYALAGNIALNNCSNAWARHAAVGTTCGSLRVPVPDYTRPGSFGSLEMRRSANNEDIGQSIDYAGGAAAEIACLSVDSLGLGRLDLLKIDVEAMELEVLEGARATIARCRPALVVEALKGKKEQIQPWLEAAGYQVFAMGPNLVGVHHADPLLRLVKPAH